MILQALSLSVFFIGHSLVSPAIPEMLQIAARIAEVEGRIGYQIINGAPLRVSWTEAAAPAQGTDSRAALASGTYDAVVLTEAIPLKDQIEYNDTNGYALRFYELATSANPKARVYLYETWHARTGDSAQWRQKIAQDLATWEGIVESVNGARKPGAPEMLLVPAGQAMGKLHDEIVAGRVPELSDISQIFADDIHLTDVGRYFVTMVHFATLYKKSPEGLPSRLGDYKNGPPPALAVRMQRIAWEVVQGYPRSGVGG